MSNEKATAKTVKVEGARIIFRNFSGRPSQFNREGDRNFGLVLTPEVAEQMLADGWNVRTLDPREDGDEATPYVGVTVNFANRPPRVVMLTSTTRTQLNESSVEVLDYAEIENVDVIIRGYDWEVNGKTGTKAYLQTAFITIVEDDLERKYNINENPPQGFEHD